MATAPHHAADSLGFVRPEADRPAWGNLLREAALCARGRHRRPVTIDPRAFAIDGAMRPVLLVPGFLASDRSMRVLRSVLHTLGFNTFGWHQGRNFGVKRDTMPRLETRLAEIGNATGRPVTLIGWSLGGVIARELAKLQPGHVDRVVTLGSPFSGDLRQNRAWRAYEFVAGHKVDAPPIDCDPCEKPPVPTTALWSRRDGVVSAHCACGAPGEADRTREVDCSHIGFVSEPAALHAIVDALR